MFMNRNIYIPIPIDCVKDTDVQSLIECVKDTEVQLVVVEARVPRIGYVLYCMYLYIRSSCYLCVKYIIPTGTVVLSIHQPPQW